MLKGKHETFLSDNGPIPAAEKMASLAILSWRFHGSPQSSGGHMNLPGLDFQAGESARGRNLLAFEGPDLCTSLLDIQRLLPCSLCFGRCKYRLAEASPAVILQVVIGGTTELFFDLVIEFSDSIFLRNKMDFIFTVSVHQLQSLLQPMAWGGPNHALEFKGWSAQEQALWNIVTRKSWLWRCIPFPSLERTLSRSAMAPLVDCRIQI
jgi:hypothetical protein